MPLARAVWIVLLACIAGRLCQAQFESLKQGTSYSGFFEEEWSAPEAPTNSVRVGFYVFASPPNYLIETRCFENTNSWAEYLAGRIGEHSFCYLYGIVDGIRKPLSCVQDDFGPKLGGRDTMVLWLAFIHAKSDEPASYHIYGEGDNYNFDEIRYVPAFATTQPAGLRALSAYAPGYFYVDRDAATVRSRTRFSGRLEPLAQGRSLWDFSSLDRTNAGAASYPVRWVWRRFFPASAILEPADSERVVARLSGTVTNVAFAPTPAVLPPKFNGSIPVKDLRFAKRLGGRAVVYTLTNGFLRPMSDPEVQAAFRLARNSRNQDDPLLFAIPRTWLLGLMGFFGCALFLASFWLWVLLWRRSD